MDTEYDFLSEPILYYDALNSHARSCLMLIKMLKIHVSIQPIDKMEDMNFDETYTWINSYCKLPTLVDGKITLCNGHSILIYLCQKYAPNLCPCDYIIRQKITSVLFYEGCILHRCLSHLLTDIFLAKYPNFNVEYHESKVSNVYNSLNTFLSGHSFMIGNRLTIADISVLSTVSAINTIFPMDYHGFPRLFDWFQRLKKQEFYTCNDEGIQKLRYILQNTCKFPFPSPFTKEAADSADLFSEEEIISIGKESKRSSKNEQPKQFSQKMEYADVAGYKVKVEKRRNSKARTLINNPEDQKIFANETRTSEIASGKETFDEIRKSNASELSNKNNDHTDDIQNLSRAVKQMESAEDLSQADDSIMSKASDRSERTNFIDTYFVKVCKCPCSHAEPKNITTNLIRDHFPKSYVETQDLKETHTIYKRPESFKHYDTLNESEHQDLSNSSAKKKDKEVKQMVCLCPCKDFYKTSDKDVLKSRLKRTSRQRSLKSFISDEKENDASSSEDAVSNFSKKLQAVKAIETLTNDEKQITEVDVDKDEDNGNSFRETESIITEIETTNNTSAPQTESELSVSKELLSIQRQDNQNLIAKDQQMENHSESEHWSSSHTSINKEDDEVDKSISRGSLNDAEEEIDLSIVESKDHEHFNPSSTENVEEEKEIIKCSCGIQSKDIDKLLAKIRKLEKILEKSDKVFTTVASVSSSIHSLTTEGKSSPPTKCCGSSCSCNLASPKCSCHKIPRADQKKSLEPVDQFDAIITESLQTALAEEATSSVSTSTTESQAQIDKRLDAGSSPPTPFILNFPINSAKKIKPNNKDCDTSASHTIIYLLCSKNRHENRNDKCNCDDCCKKKNVIRSKIPRFISNKSSLNGGNKEYKIFKLITREIDCDWPNKNNLQILKYRKHHC